MTTPVSLVGFRNRALVILPWAWSYVTYQRGVRLITGEAHRDAFPRVPALLTSTPSVPPRAVSRQTD